MLLTSVVDVVSVRKFPVKVNGLVLICVGLGMSVMGWGMGWWWGFSGWSLRVSSKIALGCIVWGSR